jgi:hypothetical protein
VTKNNSEETVVVKGAIPKALKLQFKILCLQKELEMSEVLEDLIRLWIEADTPVLELSRDLLSQEFEDVKAYIPKSLKRQFKLLCTQKQITIRSTLYVLIKQWVQMEDSSQ